MKYMKGSSAVNPKQKYSYKDYLGWPEDERWELINGVPYDMSPAPRIIHQEICMNLGRKLADFFDDKPCRLMFAPVDVILKKDWDDAKDDEAEVDTVVQPDLLVVCDPGKFTERNCNGAPDLVVEILSPSTGYKDMTIKYKIYEKNGVKEYWIVNPDLQTIMIHTLEEDRFSKPLTYRGEEILKSPLLPDLELDLKAVWPR